MKKCMKSKICGSVNSAQCALFTGKVKHFDSKSKKEKEKKEATETQNMRLGNAKRTSQMHTQYPFGYSCQWLRFGFFFFEKSVSLDYVLFNGSRALFMGLTSTLLKKKNFKNGSHSIIHTFKNYFTTVFSIFSELNGIQIDHTHWWYFV